MITYREELIMGVFLALNEPAFWALLAVWPASAVLYLILIIFWLRQFHS